MVCLIVWPEIFKAHLTSIRLDDILRARLKTLGVSEHRFKMNAGKSLRY